MGGILGGDTCHPDKEGEASEGYRQDGDRARLPGDNSVQHADMHYMFDAHPGRRAVPYTPMHTLLPCGLYLGVVDTCAACLPRLSNLQDCSFAFSRFARL